MHSDARRGLAAAVVCLVTVVAFETMSVATIMPDVRADVGGLSLYGWAFSGLALGQVLGIVLVGAWVDRDNPARPMLVGLVVYAVGLAVSGAATSMLVVVVGRVLQGYGAGAVPAVAYVCVGRGFPEERRAKVFAWMATAWVLPALIGPAVAGFVSHQVGWRWVFLGLIPVVVLIGVPALRPIAALGRPTPGSGAPAPGAADARRSIGLAAIAVVGTGVALASLDQASPVLAAVGFVAGATVLGGAFRRVAPPGTLRLSRGLGATVAARGLLTFSFLGADAYIALALTDVRGTSTVFAGVVLSSAALTWTAGSWIGARTISTVGPRRLVVTGVSIVPIGIAGLAAVVSTSVSPWWAIVAWLVGGLGIGLAYAALSQAVLLAAEPERMGAAASALQLSDVLGVALGTGIGGALIAIADRRGITVDGSTVHAGVLAAWAVTSIVGVVGVWSASRMTGLRAPGSAPGSAPGHDVVDDAVDASADLGGGQAEHPVGG